MKYIKFTGEHSKLKGMGFKFQKLFAGNYMQWCHSDEFRVWKKGGGDLTIDRLGQTAPIFLERFLAEQPIKMHLGYVTMWYNNEGFFTFDVDEAREFSSCEFMLDISNTAFTPESLEPLIQLIRLGWVEVAER